jgi:Dockerin type I domain
MMKANFFSAAGSCKFWMVTLVMAFLAQTQVTAQCTLVSNGLSNISLDGSCATGFTLLPSLVLANTTSCPAGNLQVQVLRNGAYVPAVGNATVSTIDIGKTLTVRTRDLVSGNSTWGSILVEDKLAPTVVCTDITIPCNSPVPAFPTVSGTSSVTFTDNCGTATISSVDVETVDVACTATINGRTGISYAIKRQHTATDAQGNVSAVCTQWIYFTRTAINPLTAFPADITLNGCASDTTPNATGRPSVGGGFCEVNVTSFDQVIPVCDGTRKILRTWTIINWCAVPPATPLVGVQIIKVQDVTGPSLVGAAPADVTISTDPNTCDRDYNLPDVIVTDECSRLTSLKAIYSVGGAVKQLNGNFATFPGNNLWNKDTLGVLGVINDLPIGTTEVTYTMTDDCGNTASFIHKVTVADLIPPTAVCDKNTIASVGSDGTTFINATTFDDGSYDNCGPVYFKARRMDAGCGQNTDFHDQVKFCCDDIGKVITVVFRAYDVNPGTGSVSQSTLADNSNDCMVQVEVQDKLRPTCSAPANVTVSCKTFDPSYWAYGTATATDNCSTPTLTVSVDDASFDKTCNRGQIRRTWEAKDATGLTSRCTQTITVTYDQDYFLHFPGDVTVTVCNGTGTYGEPKIFRKDCELTAVTFSDDTLKVVPDACFKILRKWKVINWCTFNVNAPVTSVPNPLGANTDVKVTPYPAATTGIPADSISTSASIAVGLAPIDYRQFWSANSNCYEYTQIISVNDTQAPTINGTAPADVTINDLSANSPQWYNSANNAIYPDQNGDPVFFNDPVTNIHDLCEGQVDLNINASDLCTGTNLYVRYLLFIDTDGDGTMETVVNSASIPEPGFLNIGNAFNPNYSGGLATRIDGREFTQNIGTPLRDNRFKFTVQRTVANGTVTAAVRFNTIANPNTFVQPQLPYGKHKIKWFVGDNCGNEAAREQIITIRDGKAPTVVCHNINVNIMPTGMIDVWDVEPLEYTEDNCTPTALLQTAICESCTTFPLDANGLPVKSVRFDCGDIGAKIVRIWSRDLSNPRNADFCEATVMVQDNLSPKSCTSGNKSLAGDIKGTDKTGVPQGAQGVAVTLNVAQSNSVPAGVFNFTTGTAGAYSFLNAVPTTANSTITPLNNNSQLNGVNMLDVLKIQRHILGLDPLANNYRQIAADVNNSGSITSSDIVELRKLILGAYAAFPAVESWTFVPKSFTFANANNAFVTVVPKVATIPATPNNDMHLDFEAIKMGDVTGDVTYNILMSADDRTASTLYFDAAESTVAAGQEFTVNFKGSVAAEAAQFTMALNGLEVVGTDLAENSFAIHNGALTVATDVNNFAVTFRAAKAGSLSNMISASSKITAAAAFAGAERYDVAFRFNGIVAGNGFELMQNVPNPVKNSTVISFNLPEAGAATLTFTNVEGRTIKVVKGDFAKGLNTVTVNRAELAAGVIFYQLDSKSNSDVKKMIIVE